MMVAFAIGRKPIAILPQNNELVTTCGLIRAYPAQTLVISSPNCPKSALVLSAISHSLAR